eukprot:7167153-Pyramimonas_sp.AAC.1
MNTVRASGYGRHVVARMKCQTYQTRTLGCGAHSHGCAIHDDGVVLFQPPHARVRFRAAIKEI